MRLMTTIGFFSIVRKPGDVELTVRARAQGDLDARRKESVWTFPKGRPPSGASETQRCSRPR